MSQPGYDLGRAVGARHERDLIVGWLRTQRHWTTRVLDKIADQIERGDHLEGSR